MQYELLVNRIHKTLKNPSIIVQRLAGKNIIKMDDKKYVSRMFRELMGYEMDFENPQTFVEKVNWLKIYDRNPIYTRMADKYEVKNIVKELIGEQYVIPTYGVYVKFDDIRFDELPSEFVIKCTHDCGSVEIVEDKNHIDIGKLRKKFNRCLQNNMFYYSREWVYKDIKPRIIIEKKMTDSSVGDVRDYKFFCFNGYVKALLLASERQNNAEGPYIDYYDADFNHLDLTNEWHPQSPMCLEKPNNFEKMVKLASLLSKGIPQVRVDLYEIDGKLYFGEYTFYPKGGFPKMHPDNWDAEWGKLIDLSLAYSNHKK